MKMTKRLWSAVLCIVLLGTMLCAAPVAAATVFGENVLAEEDAVFDGLTVSDKGYWGAWQPNSSTNVTVKPYAEGSENSYLELVAWQEGNTGKNATATLTKTYFEDKNIEKDAWYLVSYRYLSSRDKQGYIEIYDYDATSYVKNSKDLKSSGGEWTTGMYLFKTAEDTETLSVVCGSKGYYVASGTTTVCFDDFSIRKVVPDETGTIVNVVTGTASEDGIYTAADGKLSMQLTSTVVSAGETAVVSGYFTAPVGTEVEAKVTDVEGSGTPLAKKFTGTGSLQLFEMVGIGYNGVIEVQITGTDVTADTLSIVKDTNLLKNASFEDAQDTYWKISDNGPAPTSYYKEDGDCPDGTRYVYFGENSLTGLVQIASSTERITGTEGERFLFSVWYKTKGADARIAIYQYGTELKSSYMPDMRLFNTDGEWRKAEMTFEMLPGATSFDVYLRNSNTTTTALTEGQYVAYDLPVIQRISDDDTKLGFYNYNITTVAKPSKNDSAPYMTILGQSVSTASGLTELSATYVTKDGITQNSGKETVMLAVYENIGGKKQLVKLAVSETEVPETGKAYPTATLDLTGLSEGCEIRAFAWDSISGMKPAGNYIKTTN